MNCIVDHIFFRSPKHDVSLLVESYIRHFALFANPVHQWFDDLGRDFSQSLRLDLLLHGLVFIKLPKFLIDPFVKFPAESFHRYALLLELDWLGQVLLEFIFIDKLMCHDGLFRTN